MDQVKMDKQVNPEQQYFSYLQIAYVVCSQRWQPPQNHNTRKHLACASSVDGTSRDDTSQQEKYSCEEKKGLGQITVRRGLRTSSASSTPGISSPLIPIRTPYSMILDRNAFSISLIVDRTLLRLPFCWFTYWSRGIRGV